MNTGNQLIGFSQSCSAINFMLLPVNFIRSPVPLMSSPVDLLRSPVAVMLFTVIVMRSPATTTFFPVGIMRSPVVVILFPIVNMRSPVVVMLSPGDFILLTAGFMLLVFGIGWAYLFLIWIILVLGKFFFQSSNTNLGSVNFLRSIHFYVGGTSGAGDVAGKKRHEPREEVTILL